MKNTFYSFMFCLLCSFLLGMPLEVMSQRDISKTKRARPAPEAVSQQGIYPFSFRRGGQQDLVIPVSGQRGDLTVQVEFEGQARALAVKLLAQSNGENTEYVRVQGRSPLTLRFPLEENRSRMQTTFFVRIENLNLYESASGTASVRYGAFLADQATNPLRQITGQTVPYEVFMSLPKCTWGEAKKGLTSSGGVRIDYGNGNYIEERTGTTYLFDRELNKTFKVGRDPSSGPVVIMNVQPPGEPPELSLFTGDAASWLASVESWIDEYNEELLDEIKELMHHDQDMIDQYMRIEENNPKAFLSLTEFRTKVIRDLREY